jgi:hypothetical protein
MVSLTKGLTVALSLLLVVGILVLLFALTQPDKVAFGTSFAPVALIPLTTGFSKLRSLGKWLLGLVGLARSEKAGQAPPGTPARQG